MTENYYKIRNYKPDHSTYGGKIHDYHFNGHVTMSDIVQSIISDWRFDEQCKLNAENRERLKKNEQ